MQEPPLPHPRVKGRRSATPRPAGSAKPAQPVGTAARRSRSATAGAHAPSGGVDAPLIAPTVRNAGGAVPVLDASAPHRSHRKGSVRGRSGHALQKAGGILPGRFSAPQPSRKGSDGGASHQPPVAQSSQALDAALWHMDRSLVDFAAGAASAIAATGRRESGPAAPPDVARTDTGCWEGGAPSAGVPGPVAAEVGAAYRREDGERDGPQRPQPGPSVSDIVRVSWGTSDQDRERARRMEHQRQVVQHLERQLQALGGSEPEPRPVSLEPPPSVRTPPHGALDPVGGPEAARASPACAHCKRWAEHSQQLEQALAAAERERQKILESHRERADVWEGAQICAPVVEVYEKQLRELQKELHGLQRDNQELVEALQSSSAAPEPPESPMGAADGGDKGHPHRQEAARQRQCMREKRMHFAERKWKESNERANALMKEVWGVHSGWKRAWVSWRTNPMPNRNGGPADLT